MSVIARKQMGAALVLVAFSVAVLGLIKFGFDRPFFRLLLTVGWAVAASLTWLSGPLGRWQKIFIVICAVEAVYNFSEMVWHW